MNRHSTIASAIACLLAACASPQHSTDDQGPGSREDPIEIQTAASRSTSEGPAEYFTGKAMVEMLFGPNESRRGAAATVEFQAGARTTWHTHPLGQTLVVTAGKGWVQEWGGPRRDMKVGDVVWIPAGVKHWHGATATDGITHMAIQEQLDGKVVDWREPVTNEQYGSAGATE